MPHRQDQSLRDRMRRQFAEADFEIGFSLVDMAEAESILGNRDRAARILKEADNVFLDIQQLLERTSNRDPFEPLVGELRRAISLAKRHMQSPH